jgi:peptide-methionine (S)-S-oxide reductase
MTQKWIWSVLLLAALGVAACSQAGADGPAAPSVPGKPTPTTAPVTDQQLSNAAVADFAAGCFWGSEGTFRKVPGVIATEVGFEGGHTPHPTYEDVCTDRTGYAETVRVFYDPAKVTYHKLVDVFFENHDPTTADRQGPDVGTQYRSVIFYHTPEQRKVAEADKAQRDASGQYVGPIVTEVVPATGYYRAEEYHQDYFAKQGEDYVCHLGNGKKS